MIVSVAASVVGSQLSTVTTGVGIQGNYGGPGVSSWTSNGKAVPPFKIGHQSSSQRKGCRRVEMRAASQAEWELWEREEEEREGLRKAQQRGEVRARLRGEAERRRASMEEFRATNARMERRRNARSSKKEAFYAEARENLRRRLEPSPPRENGVAPPRWGPAPLPKPTPRDAWPNRRSDDDGAFDYEYGRGRPEGYDQDVGLPLEDGRQQVQQRQPRYMVESQGNRARQTLPQSQWSERAVHQRSRQVVPLRDERERGRRGVGRWDEDGEGEGKMEGRIDGRWQGGGETAVRQPSLPWYARGRGWERERGSDDEGRTLSRGDYDGSYLPANGSYSSTAATPISAPGASVSYSTVGAAPSNAPETAAGRGYAGAHGGAADAQEIAGRFNASSRTYDAAGVRNGGSNGRGMPADGNGWGMPGGYGSSGYRRGHNPISGSSEWGFSGSYNAGEDLGNNWGVSGASDPSAIVRGDAWGRGQRGDPGTSRWELDGGGSMAAVMAAVVGQQGSRWVSSGGFDDDDDDDGDGYDGWGQEGDRSPVGVDPRRIADDDGDGDVDDEEQEQERLSAILDGYPTLTRGRGGRARPASGMGTPPSSPGWQRPPGDMGAYSSVPTGAGGGSYEVMPSATGASGSSYAVPEAGRDRGGYSWDASASRSTAPPTKGDVRTRDDSWPWNERSRVTAASAAPATGAVLDAVASAPASVMPPGVASVAASGVADAGVRVGVAAGTASNDASGGARAAPSTNSGSPIMATAADPPRPTGYRPATQAQAESRREPAAVVAENSSTVDAASRVAAAVVVDGSGGRNDGHGGDDGREGAREPLRSATPPVVTTSALGAALGLPSEGGAEFAGGSRPGGGMPVPRVGRADGRGRMLVASGYAAEWSGGGDVVGSAEGGYSRSVRGAGYGTGSDADEHVTDAGAGSDLVGMPGSGGPLRDVDGWSPSPRGDGGRVSANGGRCDVRDEQWRGDGGRYDARQVGNSGPFGAQGGDMVENGSVYPAVEWDQGRVPRGVAPRQGVWAGEGGYNSSPGEVGYGPGSGWPNDIVRGGRDRVGSRGGPGVDVSRSGMGGFSGPMMGSGPGKQSWGGRDWSDGDMEEEPRDTPEPFRRRGEAAGGASQGGVPRGASYWDGREERAGAPRGRLTGGRKKHQRNVMEAAKAAFLGQASPFSVAGAVLDDGRTPGAQRFQREVERVYGRDGSGGGDFRPGRARVGGEVMAEPAPGPQVRYRSKQRGSQRRASSVPFGQGNELDDDF